MDRRVFKNLHEYDITYIEREDKLRKDAVRTEYAIILGLILFIITLILK